MSKVRKNEVTLMWQISSVVSQNILLLEKPIFKLGSQSKWFDWWDLTGKWCHVNTTSHSHTLDPNSNANSLNPHLCSQPIRSLNVRVSLILDSPYITGVLDPNVLNLDLNVNAPLTLIILGVLCIFKINYIVWDLQACLWKHSLPKIIDTRLKNTSVRLDPL